MVDLSDADDFVTVCRMDADWIILGFASGSVEIWQRWTLRMHQRLPPAAGYRCVRDVHVLAPSMAVQFACGGLVVYHVDTVRAEVVSGCDGNYGAYGAWPWELSRFSLGDWGLLVAVFISGQGERVYERHVASRLVAYRRCPPAGRFVQQRQIDLSNHVRLLIIEFELFNLIAIKLRTGHDAGGSGALPRRPHRAVSVDP